MKKLDKNHIHYLWHHDYWDGALSGVAQYRGEKVWFQLVDEEIFPSDDIFGTWRKFVLYRLTRDQLQYVEERHELFKKYVGTHTDYVICPDGTKRREGEVRPESEWKKFYDLPKFELDLSKAEEIGYYTA